MKLTILVATMSGTAEMVAEEVEQSLADEGHEISVVMMDEVDVDRLIAGGLFLICTSTYGFGNIPDNAFELVENLEKEKPDLSAMEYGLFVLGDRTYSDTFCGAGKHFDTLLSSLGAKRLGDMKCNDASSSELPEEVAPDWALEWINDVAAQSQPVASV